MSTVAQQPREQEQIIGTVTGTVQKNADTYQAVVQPDQSEFTKNLWTKDVALIQGLSSQIGNRLAFVCNVSHYNHPQHGPSRSLWIETVGSPAMQAPTQPMQQVAAQQLTQPQVAGGAAQVYSSPATTGGVVTVTPIVAPMGTVTQAPQADDQRGQKIMRQSAAKIAAILLGYAPEEQRTFDNLIRMSDRLVRYFDFGTPPPNNPTVEDLINQAMPQSIDSAIDGPVPVQQAGVDSEGRPQYAGDDDIPF